MPPTGPVPPRVSRETRLLLITALVSLVALWGLARVRFPDRAVSPNTLTPMLTQLASRPPIEEIPAVIAELTPRLAMFVVPVGVAGSPPDRHPAPLALPAFRVRDELAVMLLDDGAVPTGGVSIAVRDRASGVAVVRVSPRSVPVAVVWSPRRLDYPRYLVAADAAEDEVSFRPVFVGPLLAAPSDVWLDTIWLLPVRTDLVPGNLAFTADGAFAGLVISRQGRRALVPGPTVLALVDGLLGAPPAPAGHVGIRVQPVTEPIATATGTRQGVVVVHVEPGGPAAAHLQATDIIETADGHPILSVDAWRARTARLSPGTPIELSVRRAGAVQRVQLTAAALDEEPGDLPHGLTMRPIAGVGVEVLRVEPGSSAALGGIEPGDVITVFDGVPAPSAVRLSRAFAAAPEDRPVLVAVTRGETQTVLTMSRRR